MLGVGALGRASWLPLTIVREEVLGRSLVARKRALFFYTTIALPPKRSQFRTEEDVGFPHVNPTYNI